MTKTIDEIRNAVRDALTNGNYTIDSYQPASGSYSYVTIGIDGEKIGVTIYPDNTFSWSLGTKESFEQKDMSASIMNAVCDKRIAELQSQIDEIAALKK